MSPKDNLGFLDICWAIWKLFCTNTFSKRNWLTFLILWLLTEQTHAYPQKMELGQFMYHKYLDTDVIWTNWKFAWKYTYVIWCVTHLLSKELADFPSIGSSRGSARWSAFMCAEILELNCLVVSMGRIIPYITEKIKMFQTTNQSWCIVL